MTFNLGLEKASRAHDRRLVGDSILMRSDRLTGGANPIVRRLPVAIRQFLKVENRTLNSGRLYRHPEGANELPLSSLLLPSRGEKQALQR